MSKVLLINGSPNEHGCTYTALQEVIDTLHQLEVDTELLVFYGNQYAIGSFSILESGSRFYAGGCKEGRGRAADHADVSQKYGMAFKVY